MREIGRDDVRTYRPMSVLELVVGSEPSNGRGGLTLPAGGAGPLPIVVSLY